MPLVINIWNISIAMVDTTTESKLILGGILTPRNVMIISHED